MLVSVKEEDLASFFEEEEKEEEAGNVNEA